MPSIHRAKWHQLPEGSPPTFYGSLRPTSHNNLNPSTSHVMFSCAPCRGIAGLLCCVGGCLGRGIVHRRRIYFSETRCENQLLMTDFLSSPHPPLSNYKGILRTYCRASRKGSFFARILSSSKRSATGLVSPLCAFRVVYACRLCSFLVQTLWTVSTPGVSRKKALSSSLYLASARFSLLQLFVPLPVLLCLTFADTLKPWDSPADTHARRDIDITHLRTHNRILCQPACWQQEG